MTKLLQDEIKESNEKRVNDLLELANDYFVNRYYHMKENHFDSHNSVEGCYNKALEIDANDKRVLFEKSNFLVSKERHDEAILCLNKILSKNPNAYDVYFAKGKIFTELGIHSEAIQWIKKGIKIREKVQAQQSIERYDEVEKYLKIRAQEGYYS